ncbi:MAG: C1 family peptidase [Bacteroidales bacterium]|nr:C1 family peptidase [Candidatus Scybalousia scybalohippi]
MKKIIISLFAIALSFSAFAQNGNGGLTTDQLNKIKAGYEKLGANKALSKITANNDIKKLATNPNIKANRDVHFSNVVPNKGISDQKQSGRCWMFSGFNVLRNEMIQKYNLGAFELSQNYLFFYDQLEKSNMFLTLVLKHKSEPLTSQHNDWLFKNVLSDGGTFCGVIDLVTKYGVVPSTVQPETFNSNNTSRIDNLITLKLKEDALELRGIKAEAKAESRKIEMLSEIYRMLVMAYGEPTTEFTYTLKDASGKVISTEKYTPKSFYEKHIGKDLVNSYVMLMNDPSRPFYKLYEVENDRHTMDGHNWKYINLPADDIKQMAIASIKDSTLMYFSCDVGKCYDSETGTLDLNNFDYETIFDVKFGMDKKQRIQTFASGSTHAMTLKGVDLDENGKAIKWLIENSWGPSAGYEGNLIMTDEWFDEYMFRLVVDKKYVPENILKILDSKAEMLPPWDPLFLDVD